VAIAPKKPASSYNPCPVKGLLRITHRANTTFQHNLASDFGKTKNVI